MMEINSNDIFRNFIMNSMILNNEYSELEVIDDDTCCHLCAEKIKQLALIDNDLFRAFYEALISVIYLDAYKVLNLKEKELSLNNLDELTLEAIKQLANLDDLIYAVDSDKYLLEDLVKYYLEFYRMNDFRKIISYKAISPACEDILRSEFIMFENDKKEYSDNLTLDLIADIAKKQLKKLEIASDLNDAYEEILTKLIGFFSNINRDDTFLFIGMFKQLIKLDYKWIKYITDKKLRCEWLIEEELEERMYLYEDYDIDELVTEAICNVDYYEQIIDSFLSIKCDNMGIDEKIINEDIVNNYYKKITKNRVRK